MINNKINNLIVTFFNLGYIKALPGTFTSLVSGFIIYIFLIKVNPSILLQCFILFLLIWISFFSIKKYQETSKRKDPKEVVVDEVVGMYISLMFLNIVKSNFYVLAEFDYFLLSFLLFRIFTQ